MDCVQAAVAAVAAAGGGLGGCRGEDGEQQSLQQVQSDDKQQAGVGVEMLGLCGLKHWQLQ